MMKLSLLFLTLLFSFSQIQAATVIKWRNKQKGTQEVVINAHYARLQHGNSKDFTLLDRKKNILYRVDEQRQLIVETDVKTKLAEAKQNYSQLQKVDAYLKPTKNKLTIATQASQAYNMSVDTFNCSEEFFSQEALSIEYMPVFVELLTVINAVQHIQMLAIPFIHLHPCQLAYMHLQEKFKTLGIPMKTVLNNGQVHHELLSIKTKRIVPPQFFKLPKYKKITDQDMKKLLEKELSQRIQSSLQ